MANELPIRQNGIGGLVEDNPLTSAATTLTSAALAAVNVVDTTNFMWVVLDPDGIDGAPEHVKITAHTSGATTATILRGQNGTTQREHASGTRWIHGPVGEDIAAERAARVVTSETTTSTSFTDLATVGPAVSLVVPASGEVWVDISGRLYNSTANGFAYMGVAVSGATTRAADDNHCIYRSVPSGQELQWGGGFLLTGLTPGLSTFTAKYRVSVGTGTFTARNLKVRAL